jgi:hypothetical protein
MTCRGSPEPLFKSTLLFIQFSKEAGRGIGSISPKAVPMHRQTTKNNSLICKNIKINRQITKNNSLIRKNKNK